jgi:hypothetical protein
VFVCPPYQLLKQLADFMKFSKKVTEGDLDAMIFNAIAATILKWWMFTLLR